ncbi:hypothetical protein SRHO_G00247430 [Serrasalmus rhombeus]
MAHSFSVAEISVHPQDFPRRLAVTVTAGREARRKAANQGLKEPQDLELAYPSRTAEAISTRAWTEEALIKPVADDFNKYALRTKAILSAEYPARVITGQRASGVDPQFPLHASLCLLYTAITAKRLPAPATAGRRGKTAQRVEKKQRNRLISLA